MAICAQGKLSSKYNQLIMVKQVVPGAILMTKSVGKKCRMLTAFTIKPYSMLAMEIKHVSVCKH